MIFSPADRTESGIPQRHYVKKERLCATEDAVHKQGQRL